MSIFVLSEFKPKQKIRLIEFDFPVKVQKNRTYIQKEKILQLCIWFYQWITSNKTINLSNWNEYHYSIKGSTFNGFELLTIGMNEIVK